MNYDEWSKTPIGTMALVVASKCDTFAQADKLLKTAFEAGASAKGEQLAGVQEQLRLSKQLHVMNINTMRVTCARLYNQRMPRAEIESAIEETETFLKG